MNAKKAKLLRKFITLTTDICPTKDAAKWKRSVKVAKQQYKLLPLPQIGAVTEVLKAGIGPKVVNA